MFGKKHCGSAAIKPYQFFTNAVKTLLSLYQVGQAMYLHLYLYTPTECKHW